MECSQMRRLLKNFESKVNLSYRFNTMCSVSGHQRKKYGRLPFSSGDLLLYD